MLFFFYVIVAGLILSALVQEYRRESRHGFVEEWFIDKMDALNDLAYPKRNAIPHLQVAHVGSSPIDTRGVAGGMGRIRTHQGVGGGMGRIRTHRGGGGGMGRIRTHRGGGGGMSISCGVGGGMG